MRSRGALDKYNRLVDFGNAGVTSGCVSGECKVYRMIDGVKTLIMSLQNREP